VKPAVLIGLTCSVIAVQNAVVIDVRSPQKIEHGTIYELCVTDSTPVHMHILKREGIIIDGTQVPNHQGSSEIIWKSWSDDPTYSTPKDHGP